MVPGLSRKIDGPCHRSGGASQNAPRLMVGVDAGPLLGRGGISGYVRPLVRSLLAMDPDTDYRLVLRGGRVTRDRAGVLDGLAPVTRLRIPDRVLFFWWDQLGWTLPVRRRLWKNLDLFLATCLVAPVLPSGRVISIVYDLTPLRLPELFADHREFRRRLERLIRRSAAVVAISQQTKQDLVEVLGANPAVVRVIYPGKDEAFRPICSLRAAEVAARHGMGERYILYVGAQGPHKNVPALLRAYQRARLEGGLTAKLALVGSPRWGEETLAVMETLRIRDAIILTGEVSADELPPLYAGADVFIFPSRYEGFGLPVLEAMACGTPVIVSNQGALPEVAGAAGCYVDPDDEGSLARAICRIVGEPQTRTRMAAAGLEQAARFSWARSAAQLLTLFREVAAAPLGPRLGRGGTDGA